MEKAVRKATTTFMEYHGPKTCYLLVQESKEVRGLAETRNRANHDIQCRRTEPWAPMLAEDTMTQ